MKKLLLIILFFCIKQVNSQTTVPGGYVYGTWTLAGSPYLIQGGILVPNDSTLTINPGVVVEFQGHDKLFCKGRILALGAVSDSITFTIASSSSSTGWWGIRFDSTANTNDTSKFFYCKVQYGNANASSGNDAHGGGFFFNDFSKCIISNCNISNNNAMYGGGAIYCTSSSPIIKNSSITNSYSYNGGEGIDCENNSHTIIDNNFISGGNIYFENSSLTITNNTISSGNTVCSICCWNASSIISNNIIESNICTNGGNGGAILLNNSSSTITYNKICNNSSVGISYGNQTGVVTNVTISNNIIANNTSVNGFGGGAISLYNASPTLINNTICYNKSSGNGGALYCDNGSKPSIYNSILYGNTSALSGNQIYLNDQYSQPPIYNCNIQGGTSAFGLNGNVYVGTYSNNIDFNPSFVAPSAGSGNSFNGLIANWSLQSNSPCINAGNPTGSYPATDIAGNPRVYGSIIDIGAYEYQGLVGIKQLSIENTQINIYPNPTSSNFTIETINIEKQTLQVFDVTGKMVLNQSVEGKTTIDVTSLSEGVYNLSLINSTGVINKKLVIVR
jgi:hypothetical protein